MPWFVLCICSGQADYPQETKQLSVEVRLDSIFLRLSDAKLKECCCCRRLVQVEVEDTT